MANGEQSHPVHTQHSHTYINRCAQADVVHPSIDLIQPLCVSSMELQIALDHSGQMNGLNIRLLFQPYQRNDRHFGK